MGSAFADLTLKNNISSKELNDDNDGVETTDKCHK